MTASDPDLVDILDQRPLYIPVDVVDPPRRPNGTLDIPALCRLYDDTVNEAGG